jgi:Protein of unknown function (DUF3788)
MADKEILLLSDRQIRPTEDLIFSIIGDRKILWQKIMNYLSDNYKDAAGTWNYYNDGKQWLFKMVRKKKTIFWLGVLKDTFRVTFYFGDKAEPAIINSDLPKSVRDNFMAGKHYGKIRAISTKITGLSDVETITKLIDIKVKLK